MMLTLRLFSLLIISFVLALTMGCEGAPREQEADHGVEEHEFFDESTLKINESGHISGRGRFRFSAPLQGINSREHYVLQGIMDEEGELTLHSHFSGFHKDNGFNVKMIRQGEGLVVQASAPGYQYVEVCHIEGMFRADSEFRLRLEVHDGVVAGSRLLVWSDRVTLQGERYRPLDVITPQLAACDTAAQNLYFEVSGQGPYWGLNLDEVILRAAYREAPFVN